MKSDINSVKIDECIKKLEHIIDRLKKSKTQKHKKEELYLKLEFKSKENKEFVLILFSKNLDPVDLTICLTLSQARTKTCLIEDVLPHVKDDKREEFENNFNEQIEIITKDLLKDSKSKNKNLH